MIVAGISRRLAISVITIALLATTTNAEAERLYSPVYVKQTTGACGDLAGLQYRDQLIRQGRTETLDGINTMSAFTGGCANVPEGQWLFYEGHRGVYVCLRVRVGADCAWVRREAVGDIAEVFPGRTSEQGNKGVTCASWGPVVQKSFATERDYDAKYQAGRSKGVGEDFAKGMLSAVVGTFTGGPDHNAVQHANDCVYYFATAQEKARRLTAYKACPALGANGQQQKDRDGYTSLIRLVNDICVPH